MKDKESITNPKYTPEITIVEECGREEIGVGATIAFNNHPIKGYCADFENIIKIKDNERR